MMGNRRNTTHGPAHNIIIYTYSNAAQAGNGNAFRFHFVRFFCPVVFAYLNNALIRNTRYRVRGAVNHRKPVFVPGAHGHTGTHTYIRPSPLVHTHGNFI